jgi:hypothetical protein
VQILRLKSRLITFVESLPLNRGAGVYNFIATTSSSSSLQHHSHSLQHHSRSLQHHSIAAPDWISAIGTLILAVVAVMKLLGKHNIFAQPASAPLLPSDPLFPSPQPASSQEVIEVLKDVKEVRELLASRLPSPPTSAPPKPPQLSPSRRERMWIWITEC